MPADLTSLLIEAGLLQFGLFVVDPGRTMPFRISLELLPSYPDILSKLADGLAASMARLYADRLLCPADSLPSGVALSLRTAGLQQRRGPAASVQSRWRL